MVFLSTGVIRNSSLGGRTSGVGEVWRGRALCDIRSNQGFMKDAFRSGKYRWAFKAELKRYGARDYQGIEEQTSLSCGNGGL